jgi:hypothetical protein
MERNMNKRCHKCGENKPLDQFNKRASSKDGKSHECNSCQTIRHSEYYIKNKEKILDKCAQYYVDNSDRIKSNVKKYRHNNPEKHKASRIKYAENNKEIISVKKALYKKNNRIKLNQAERARKANNPTYKIACLLRSRVNEILESKTKVDSTIGLLGCSVSHFVKYLESKFQSGMSWSNHSLFGWHIDHIIPCTKFDLSDPGQQRKCFHFSNMQPLWAKDNLRKNNKIQPEQQMLIAS